MVRIHDTLQRRTVPLQTRTPGVVSMYVCGPTVYDHPHVGHGRTALVFDIVRRYLQWRGYRVHAVANVTDIEDRIIARAADEGRTEPDVSDEYTASYIEQMGRLNVLPPHHRPRATEYVEQMVELVGELLDRGAAYVVEGKGVYFDTAAAREYGTLSGRTRQQLIDDAGARVEVDTEKKAPIDFVLWKAAKPGEPSWDTPWGPGRPGWHTECVAMSLGILGDGFDLHGGGDDLVFPHHENEVAQAEATGHAYARHWMHSAMVNVGGEKMSKSLGNFWTLGDALDHVEPRAFRLLVLQSHHRSTMEIQADALASAAEGVGRLDAFVRRVEAGGADLATDERDAEAVARFRDAMDDDFATPTAVDVIFGLVRAGNSALDAGDVGAAGLAAATAIELAGALGLELGAGDAASADGDAERIDALIGERRRARDQRDFATADRIRDELAAEGIVLEDGADGTTWHRARPAGKEPRG